MNSRNYVMSGNRFVLDTNAVIQLLKGNTLLEQIIAKADYLAISVITQLEFFSFSGLPQADRQLFDLFKSRVEIVNLTQDNEALIEKIYELRKSANLKLPDAIIAASALANKAVLITADQKLANALSSDSLIYEVI